MCNWLYAGNYIILNCENNDIKISYIPINIKSAENLCKTQGFSETTRQLPDHEDDKFWKWFAGVIDGDGNFDIRLNSSGNNNKVLKQIRIKLDNRDIRILKRIQDYLHTNRIINDKNKPYFIYMVFTK